MADITKGTLVFIHTNWCNKRLACVEDITPKGFIKVNDVLYNPQNLCARGLGRWEVNYISVPTESEIEDYKKERFTNNIKRKVKVAIDDITYEQAIDLAKYFGIIGGDENG